MSKGSRRRPGNNYGEGFARLFGKPKQELDAMLRVYKQKQELDTVLTVKDLEGLKLVSDTSYIASTELTQVALERVFQQASQGWGVRQEGSVLLKLASDLTTALVKAERADESGRLLKGAQMALGRERKIKEGLQADIATLNKRIARLLSQPSADGPLKATEVVDKS